MKLLESRNFWGVLLILGGVLFLLQSLGYLPGGNLFFAALLAFGGFLFISAYFNNRANWWALIPGIILGSLALTMLLDTLFAGNSWSGAVFLGGIGLSFWAVYLTDRRNWWAIIPGGVMATLALVALIDSLTRDEFETGGIFFIGLGLTFALVGVLPSAYGQMRWAFIPATVLLIMGFLITAAATPATNFIWPAALIAGGALLLIRALRSRS